MAVHLEDVTIGRAPLTVPSPEARFRLEPSPRHVRVVFGGETTMSTRAALIGSYVEETPQAELAARLGLSEGALRVRLHRGKLALRQALTPANAIDAQDGWQATRIWCPFCGSRRLESRLKKV